MTTTAARREAPLPNDGMDALSDANLTIGTRVRSTMDIGGIIRPFVPRDAVGVVDAVLQPTGHLVRFDADDRPVAVHDDEIAADAEAARIR